MEGFVNSPDAVAGLEFYKELYKCCTPPGASNVYMGESADAFKSGQVAMHMNFAFTWPGLYKDPNVGGDKIGFFVNPAAKEHFAQLGGQGISVLANTDNMDGALAYIKWFVKPEVQAKWWQLGGFSCAKSVLEDPGFVASAPYASRLPRLHGDRAGFLGRSDLRGAAAGHAEARARLRRRRPGNGAGSARLARQGLDRGVRGRRQDLTAAIR